ncbi:S1C family serine protease [Treponema sp.]|uniref:S1C family serine protease n=1 Tax=Treponema sp. TaxID=166 RepID=UPI00298EBDD0|nr:S1C family serine protease [Treponema sp.]MCR5613089.1 S1C family serine protease [Treponema sp.]
MIQKTTKYIAFTALFFLGSAFFSCASLKSEQPAEPVQAIDYTQEDVRKSEIERIHKILMEHPVEALWRAVLLDDKDTVEEISKSVRDFCASSLDQKDYLELYFAHKSLCNAGFEQLANEVISKQELDKIFYDKIPGHGIAKSSVTKENISSCIAGTVTVWVDLGIKVQMGRGYADRVIGSGFFIDERGYFITNHHVIADVVNPKYEGYGKVFIKLAGDEETRIPAKVIGWDSIHDLALLKTEVKPPYVFSLGSSSDLKPGDRIYAIGSPLGLESTLTSGVVSSTNRKLFSTGSVLQIDAAVNSGNSGGPCIDSKGNVQAVVFAGIEKYQGLNFAIPIEYLKQELAILYYGGLRQVPWLGAYGRTYKVGTKESGLEVLYFSPGSSLSRAGIKAGDIITAIDGVAVKSMDEIHGVLRSYVPGTIVKCDYINSDKEKKNCILYLTERPKAPGYYFYQRDTIQNSFIAIFGISMTPSSTANNRTYLITDVVKGSIADESGFSENDPVTIGKIQFNDEKTAILCEFSIKRRKKGYLDVSLGMTAMLDSGSYF